MTTYEITFNERTKIGKNFLVYLEQNKKYFKLHNPAKMTEDEFDAMLEDAREQYARGEYIELEYENISKYLGLE